MLEKVFCPNTTPSLSSGNHLFYKAEYMGRICLNQVWAHPSCQLAQSTWHLKIQVRGAGTWHTTKTWHVGHL